MTARPNIPRPIPILLFLLLLSPFAPANEVFFGEGTPVFVSPEPKAPLTGILGADAVLESDETRFCRPDRNPYFRGDLPLSFAIVFHHITLPDGRRAWASPNLQADPGQGFILARLDLNRSWLLPMTLFGLATAAAVCLVVRRHWMLEAFNATRPPPVGHSLALIGVLLLLYATIFTWMRYKAGCIVPAITDEHDYFQIATDIIHRRAPESWHFNISIALLYIPLILLTGATSYADIHPIVATLNVAFLTPATLVMAYFLVLRFTKRPRIALATIAALVLLPILYHPIEFHGKTSAVFKAVFGVPFFGAMSYRLYYYAVWVGWSGLADTFSTFAVTLTLSLGTFLRSRSWLYHLLVGACFGLACFLRINNIFFSPVVAYLLWQRARDERTPLPQLMVNGGLAVGAFVIMVLPQLVANHLQFGNFTTFPYVLHNNDASKGFEWSWVPYSTHFLMGTNWLHMVAGAVGILLCRRLPASRFLCLWSVPLILFFCGYTVTGASPMRFTLSVYAPLWAAFFLALDRYGAGKRPAVIWTVALANILLVSPCHRWKQPFSIFYTSIPSGTRIAEVLTVLLPLVSLALILRGLRGQARGFWLVVLIVFHAGWWPVPPLLFLAALGWAVWDWGEQIRSSYLFPPSDTETAAA